MFWFGSFLQARLYLSVAFPLLHPATLHAVQPVLKMPLYGYSGSNDSDSTSQVLLLESHIPFLYHYDNTQSVCNSGAFFCQLQLRKLELGAVLVDKIQCCTRSLFPCLSYSGC